MGNVCAKGGKQAIAWGLWGQIKAYTFVSIYDQKVETW